MWKFRFLTIQNDEVISICWINAHRKRCVIYSLPQFFLTAQKPNFLISDVLCDDKEIMADPIRGQKLFQQKKNLFHNISLCK